MKRDVLGLACFIVYFLTISYLYYYLTLIYYIIVEYLPDIDFGETLNLIIGLFLMLLPVLYKIFSPFIISIFILKKIKNSLLLEIYNNIQILLRSIFLLIFLDIIGFLINKFVFHALEFVNYIILCSGLLAFLPIVLVALVNIILRKKSKGTDNILIDKKI